MATSATTPATATMPDTNLTAANEVESEESVLRRRNTAASAYDTSTNDDPAPSTSTSTPSSSASTSAPDGQSSCDGAAADGPSNDKSDQPSTSSASDDAGKENDEDRPFECNICLDVARDAVISLCGHLFCWPCLHQWLETRPQRQICPVCKAGISREKVVPLYGRGGNAEGQDPRDKVPPRPRGQRPEPEAAPGAGAGLFGPFNLANQNGFQMSFGIGAFPFGFFSTNFNFGDQQQQQQAAGGQNGPAAGSAMQEEEQFLHKVFLWVAFAFIFWLMVA